MAAQFGQLRGHLVILHERGRALMASAPLPAWRAGMPLARARRQYGTAVFVERSHVREGAMMDAVARRLTAYTARVMTLSPGCFLLQDPDPAGLAHLVCRDGRLQGGAADYAEWARLAAHQAAPGVLRHVTDGGAFLQAMPVAAMADLLGDEGEEATERLGRFGLYSLAMVAHHLSERHLRQQFGEALGTQINHFLRPAQQPTVPVYLPPREIDVTHEMEYPAHMSAPWVRTIILRLAHSLAERLTGMAALSLVLRAFVPGRGSVQHHYMSRRGLSSSSDLCRLAVQLYEKLCGGTQEMLSVRLIAGHLITPAYAQGQLFTSRAEHPALRRAVCLLQKRYGPQVLMHAERKESLFPEERLRFTPVQWS